MNHELTSYQDINEIMNRCGFTSTAYATAQSTIADTIVVAATRPTNAAQLTTTIAGVGGGAGVTTVTSTGVATTATRTTTTGLAGATSTGLATSAGSTGMQPFINGWNIMAAYAVGVALVTI